ncbi:MAG TPA: hypothetical protein VFZ59_13955 [Verrucomicrobiae bacterium]|nr:hypothetical protein [Verrucomicrobiae bacterium]
MKVCIQNCLTHDYVGEGRDWVKSEARAKNFDSSVAAIEFLTQQKLADCDVVLKFDPGEYDLRLSVSENCRRVSE